MEPHESRLEALERAVDDLRRQVADLAARLPDAAQTSPVEPASRPKGRPREIVEVVLPPPKPKRDRRLQFAWRAEDVFIKGGIGLLLLGVAFLFLYAVNEGWLGPWVRVAFGLALATGLVVFGLRVRPRRMRFGQALVGGGIAAFYITLFAAYQVLDLVPYVPAFAGMVAVTVLGLGLALQQDDPLLSAVATIGGFATPFLLYTGSGNLVGLVSYTCLLLAATALLYLIRGWRALLLTMVVGGWLVFVVGVEAVSPGSANVAAHRLALQAGIGFALLTTWLLPVVRQAVQGRPDAWLDDDDAPAAKYGFGVLSRLFTHPPHTLAVTVPLVALGLTQALWSHTWIDDTGWVALALSVLAAAVSGWLRGRDADALAYTHALSALLLFTISLSLFFEGPTLFVLLSTEAFVLHRVADRIDARAIRWAGHALFFIVGFWMASRFLFGSVDRPPVLNLRALAHLAAIVLAVAASFTLRHRTVQLLYRGAAHVALLVWIAHELDALPDGTGYISIAWGVYAVVLLVVGLRRENAWLRTAGLLTLALVVGKLFVVDLARLEAIWRILLFLGFGALFLALGYYMPWLWRTDADEAAASPPSEVNPSTFEEPTPS